MMKIITDNGLDLAPEILDNLDVEIVPLKITLDGTDYRGGIDIQSDAFYKLLRTSDGFPTTTQPAPGEFEEVYTRWIEHDPDMISIHMSQHLSGTWNSARLGAEAANKKGANVTVIDSHSVSGPLGWQVEAAARAVKAGWDKERVLATLHEVAENSRVIFSPDMLKYLVHGGRVSHIQGFAGNLLNIKPVLQVRYETGKIESVSRVRTMKKAIAQHIEVIKREWGTDTPLRVQIEHADNEEMATYAHSLMDQAFDCHFVPTTSITPLIGAHTGPGLLAIVYAPQRIFDNLP